MTRTLACAGVALALLAQPSLALDAQEAGNAAKGHKSAAASKSATPPKSSAAPKVEAPKSTAAPTAEAPEGSGASKRAGVPKRVAPRNPEAPQAEASGKAPGPKGSGVPNASAPRNAAAPVSAGAVKAAAVANGAVPSKGDDLHALIAQHAKAHGIPEDLVHRVVKRESRYNPRAVGRGGAMGLMQIKHATARGLGYAGSAAGLLSAETNLIYGVKYLAGAYKVADGDPNRAVAFFARGYYYDAKRKGLQTALASQKAKPETVEAVAVADVQRTASTTASLFQAAPAPYFDGDPK